MCTSIDSVVNWKLLTLAAKPILIQKRARRLSVLENRYWDITLFGLGSHLERK
jgi:hypothetical protein